MGLPEDIQQLVVSYFGRVKFDSNHFGMAGVAAANLLVGWVFDMTTLIAGHHRFDPVNAQEYGVATPETAEPKRGKFGWCCGVRFGWGGGGCGRHSVLRCA